MASSLSNDQFWHFSDQIRLQSSSLSSLSLGDSIWAIDSSLSRRRNEDPRAAKPAAAEQPRSQAPPLLPGPKGNAGKTGYFGKEISRPAGRRNLNYNEDFAAKGASFPAKKKSSPNNNNNNNNNNDGKSGGEKAVDKKFKTLPAAEALPRGEPVGGYIFVCNNDTMPENLQRMLFGLPPRYRDSVRAIKPGLPLFLYNYSTHQLFGIYQAASFGGTNIDPSAWEDKKCPGESRFPAQVRATTRKTYEPLEEEDFRPILHHYDGPKFRLELSVPEALALLDKFEEKSPFCN